MKLLFSEHVSDYDHYIFPYAVWGFPEPGETPSQMFDAGFLPSSRNLDRFYLCRQVRVDLEKFRPSSENRRVLRKGAGITFELVARGEYEFTPERRAFFKNYADIKFGKDVMSYARLDALFASPIISHLLVFTDTATGAEVGTVTLYLAGDALAFYYYAFYDLNYFQRNLGLFLMTTAVTEFARRGTRHLYLGSCYSENALYKTQFGGAEFFNGFRWSDRLKELKYLLQRDHPGTAQHLVETEEFRQLFYEGDLACMVDASRFGDRPRLESRL